MLVDYWILIYGIHIVTAIQNGGDILISEDKHFEFTSKTQTDRTNNIKTINKTTRSINKEHIIEQAISKRATQQHLIKVENLETLTDFIHSAIIILNKYETKTLKHFISIFKDELKKYNYNGCKFSELTVNNGIVDFIIKEIDEIQKTQINTLRNKMLAFALKIQNEDYSKHDKKIVDYVNTLYKKKTIDKFKKVLIDLDDLSTAKANNIVNIINQAVRSLFFNHYSKLNHYTRAAFKSILDEYWQYFREETPSKFDAKAYFIPNTVNKLNSLKENKTNIRRMYDNKLTGKVIIDKNIYNELQELQSLFKIVETNIRNSSKIINKLKNKILDEVDHNARGKHLYINKLSDLDEREYMRNDDLQISTPEMYVKKYSTTKKDSNAKPLKKQQEKYIYDNKTKTVKVILDKSDEDDKFSSVNNNSKIKYKFVSHKEQSRIPNEVGFGDIHTSSGQAKHKTFASNVFHKNIRDKDYNSFEKKLKKELKTKIDRNNNAVKINNMRDQGKGSNKYKRKLHNATDRVQSPIANKFSVIPFSNINTTKKYKKTLNPHTFTVTIPYNKHTISINKPTKTIRHIKSDVVKSSNGYYKDRYDKKDIRNHLQKYLDTNNDKVIEKEFEYTQENKHTKKHKTKDINRNNKYTTDSKDVEINTDIYPNFETDDIDITTDSYHLNIEDNWRNINPSKLFSDMDAITTLPTVSSFATKTIRVRNKIATKKITSTTRTTAEERQTFFPERDNNEQYTEEETQLDENSSAEVLYDNEDNDFRLSNALRYGNVFTFEDVIHISTLLAPPPVENPGALMEDNSEEVRALIRDRIDDKKGRHNSSLHNNISLLM